MLRYCTVSCTCTHMSCYGAVPFLALARMHLKLHYCIFPCACTQMACYFTARPLAPAHMLLFLYGTFSCTCTHTYGTLRYVVFHLHMYMSRQATVHSLALAQIRHATVLSLAPAHMSCYATVRSLALAHIRHTTLLHVLLRLHMYFLLRRFMFSCTRTHTHATLLRHAMHLSDCNWHQLDSGLPRSITALQKGRLNPVWYEYT